MLVTGCAQLPVLLGSLLVAITGLPLGIAAGVTVTGPSGFNEILNATTLLSNVTAGSYSLSASTLNPADPIVTATFLVDAIDSDVEVSASATAVANVRYLRDRGSGALWVAYSAGVSIAVSGFDCNQLATGVGAPTTISTTVTAQREVVAFDGAGNMWVAVAGNNTIESYAAADLATSGTPAPSVVISDDGGGDLNFPNNLAFDGDGNLWVGCIGSDKLLRYDADQLTTSGNPTPAVTISDDGFGSLDSIAGMAFDSNGDLWISNAFNVFTVVKFDQADLTATGAPTPTVINSSSFGGPRHLAFDASGNLFVVDNAFPTYQILKFNLAQLVNSGNITPDVIISDNGPNLGSPGGLAFDNSGGLWVVNGFPASLVRFTADQLVSSGAPPPTITIIYAPVGPGHPAGILSHAPRPADQHALSRKRAQKRLSRGRRSHQASPTPGWHHDPMPVYEFGGGWLELIVGPMFSGKSEELIRRVPGRS